MKNKIMSGIIAFFLFMFTIPQSCLAELGNFFTDEKQPEISCAVSKAFNLIDISNKVVKKYYDGTKDFFFNMCMQNAGDGRIPEYSAQTNKLFVSLSVTSAAGNKKDVLFGSDALDFSRFANVCMRGSPPGETEITKLYLLSIEALQKGSVPAFAYINNNILI